MSEYNLKTIPWLDSHPKNYEFCENLNEPIYDPSIHLALQFPEYVVNLKFEKLYLNDLKSDDQLDRLREFLEPGLAFSAPFKVLSDEGVRVISDIVNYHLKNSSHLNNFSKRQAWCLRGLGYVSRFIRDFNRCEVVSNKMSFLAGKQIVPHSMPFNYSHVNVGEAATGKRVDHWHFDSVGFVLVIIMNDPSGLVGGELQVLKRDRAETNMSAMQEILNTQNDSYTPDEIMTVNYSGIGNGIFMQGSHILHTVTPVLQSTVGPRISVVNSFQTASIFDDDWTKFSTFRDRDPQHIAYVEYARLIAWRAQGMLDYVINNIGFNSDNDEDCTAKKKAVGVLGRALNELQNGYSLLTDKADDLIGYYDSNKKAMSGYEDERKKLKSYGY